MGSGGVGGYFGARLAKGGADVTFIARGAHLAAMRERGLVIESTHEPIVLPTVNATDDPATIGPVDVVLFSVKLWDTESAAHSLLPLMRPGTAIISLQNGVQKDDTLRAVFGDAAVMGGVAYMATTVVRPGVIGQTGAMQRMIFGEFDGRRSPRAEALLAACKAGGIDAEISPDIRRAIWEKYVFLVGLSGATTSMRMPLGPIRANPRSRQFLLDLMREDRRRRPCARRRLAGGFRRAAPDLRRHPAGRHDVVDVSRPRSRPAARTALAQWWRRRSRRRGRRADAGEPRRQRYLDPARRRTQVVKRRKPGWRHCRA